MQVEPDHALLQQLPDSPSRLVFILGPHRSGTTMLHHLLARTGCFNYVSAYDVIEYPRLLSNRAQGCEAARKTALAAALSNDRDRGLDGIPIGPEQPEEYGFVLNLHIYEPRLTEATLPRFRALCAKRRFLAGNDRPLLLKEPSEFYGNLERMRRWFPDARFLFIHRHPLHVLDSQVRAWRKALEAPSRYGSMLSPEYAEIFGSNAQERAKYQAAYRTVKGCEWVLEYLARGYQHYLEQIQAIPRDRVLVETYESLCAGPRRYFMRVAKLLDLPLPEPDLAFIATRQNAPAPEVLEAWRRGIDGVRDYLDEFDYGDMPD
jgi:hypothetical protein